MSVGKRLRDWLAGVLGRRSEAATNVETEPEALDLRPDFLNSLLGPGSAADYRRLEADKQAARNEIPDIESYVENLEWFRDAIFFHICEAQHALSSVDWVGDPDEFLESFNAQLARCGATPLDDAAKTAVLDYANAQPVQRGDYIGYMFGPMAEYAEKAGLAILDINEGSDCYHFVIAPAGLCEKWAGANLSAFLRVEYPGWQFKKQLLGSPYSRFYRDRFQA